MLARKWSYIVEGVMEFETPSVYPGNNPLTIMFDATSATRPA